MKTKLEKLLEKTEKFLNDLEPGQKDIWTTLLREIKEEIEKEKTILKARMLRNELKTLKQALNDISNLYGQNNAYYARFLTENELEESKF